ncbi:hypothetical protein PC9H_002350 [Pleurotus ostreatus]|uniref:NAD(P)-binding protein n=2 Tax=Pleurotus ostreatus TaxID=5322 RepID=A0A067N402_PLEO1|nr:uncharacterized protein PC9H_002350 [Pleurotus ostreatus]KAF7416090.1 hypothetical protein PC9H_002350 [Pleurotus ostreatus]KDQ22594.1 hypothetical protein PLEOSDRAFT_1068846 [Pleurotus ostreatus PC15]
MAPQVWFITGASRGLGRSVTETVLQNGDIVVATARSTSVFSDLTSKYPESQLLVLSLDVSNVDAIKAAFKAATDKFGRIDVVYNNAGAFTVGEAEAIPEADARKLFDVNFWAASNVALEAVRVLREVNKPQGGRIITIGSATGFAPLPGSNYYAASKFAIEGFIDALSMELDPAWNIRLTLVRPGGYDTGWEKGAQFYPAHPAYTAPHMPTEFGRQYMKTFKGYEGDPVKFAQTVYFKVAKAENPPSKLSLGLDCVGMVEGKLKAISDEAEKYKSWSAGLNKSDPPLNFA